MEVSASLGRVTMFDKINAQARYVLERIRLVLAVNKYLKNSNISR